MTADDDTRPRPLSHPDRHEERKFLRGVRDDPRELATAGRIFLEYTRGFEALGRIGRCVTVFGSARFTEEHRYYQLARRMGKRLAVAMSVRPPPEVISNSGQWMPVARSCLSKLSK